MRTKLKVLYVSAEAHPYAKAGGLGEVGGAYPSALAAQGVDVRRVIPYYKATECASTRYKGDFLVEMGSRKYNVIIRMDQENKEVPTYFIDNAWYFHRDGIYSHEDDGERFLLFCKSVLDMLPHIRFYPHIIHCNDWHTGFIPLLVRTSSSPVKTVFTIHNLRYQGWASPELVKELALTKESLSDLGHPEWLNFMKAGIIHSDAITTVSPGYAAEMLTPERGESLDPLLKGRDDEIRGILNGIDEALYDPSKEEDLPFAYDSEDLSPKMKNKEMLQKELGLESLDVPLVSMITRLDEQKGLGILSQALRRMKMQDFQFVLMGSGRKEYQELFRRLKKAYPGRIALCFDYDAALARRIYAASDLYVMPSRYEPGGLGQLYAMKYGAVPVVRSTGGLRDTVIDMDQDEKRANGFCFKDYSPDALADALSRALKSYGTPIWDKLQKNGMKQSFSWSNPAKEYIKLYKELLKSK